MRLSRVLSHAPSFRTPISTATTRRAAVPIARKTAVALSLKDIQVDNFNVELRQLCKQSPWLSKFLDGYCIDESHNVVESGVIAVPVTLQSDLELNCLVASVSEAVVKSCVVSQHARWVVNQVELTFATPRLFIEGVQALLLVKPEIDSGELRARLSIRHAESQRFIAVGVTRFAAAT